MNVSLWIGKGSKQGKDSKGKKKDKGEESKVPSIVSSEVHNVVGYICIICMKIHCFPQDVQ